MKKVINIFIIFFILVISIYIIFFGDIKCFIYETFGIYCPGCGITRMFRTIFNLKLYDAFRYNHLAFILCIYFIYYIFKCIIKKEFKLPPAKVMIIILIFTIIYTTLRNIFPLLGPNILKLLTFSI